MGKETNGITMRATPAPTLEDKWRAVGGYREDARDSERDTDPEITKDYIASVPVALRLTLVERLRLWVGRAFARWAWRLMP